MESLGIPSTNLFAVALTRIAQDQAQNPAAARLILSLALRLMHTHGPEIQIEYIASGMLAVRHRSAHCVVWR
jgi:hypothetical protein